MTLTTKRTSLHITFALGIAFLLMLAGGVPPAQASSHSPVRQQGTAVQGPQTQSPDATNAPSDCIDPLKAGHIAATLISLLPLPGWADAADAAAYGLNIALKHCPPVLTAPADIVIQQPNQGCYHHLLLPTPKDLAELVALDRAIIEELLADPDLNLSPS